MDMTNRPARPGFLAALVALLLGPLVFGAQTALAHPNQATYWGGGQEPGTTISASIGGETCDSFETDRDGFWVLYIEWGDCNGNAVEGATVHFHIGDALAAETATWTELAELELALTLAPTDGDGMDDGMDDTDATDDGMDDTDAMDDGMDDTDATDDGMDDTDATDDGMDDTDATDDTEGMTPGDKGDTGHAGFAAASGTSSMLLVLALGVLAAAGVAGARTVTGRVDG